MSEIARQEADDAVRAFDALRDEVASLRKGIELVYRQGQEAKSVDYSLTLGQMAKTLQAPQERLKTIEAKPALGMTPEIYRARIEEMGRVAGQSVERATRELRETLGRTRSKREQREWLFVASAGGVMAGMLLWTILVETLPWGMGTWPAAVPIAGGKWDAGLELLHEASPDAFQTMSTLYTTCGPQPVAFCQEAIAEKTVASAKQTGVVSDSARHKTRP